MCYRHFLVTPTHYSSSLVSLPFWILVSIELIFLSMCFFLSFSFFLFFLSLVLLAIAQWVLLKIDSFCLYVNMRTRTLQILFIVWSYTILYPFFPFYLPTDTFGGYSDQHGVRPYKHTCAVHNFDTLRHILIIFGRNVKKDQ